MGCALSKNERARHRISLRLVQPLTTSSFVSLFSDEDNSGAYGRFNQSRANGTGRALDSDTTAETDVRANDAFIQIICNLHFKLSSSRAP